ncbi:MAG: fumarate reductase subunit C [Betaproteobacteria bacterium]|nr:fumarate reductase subunit C [Betaproteobacteria bacterium]
MSARKPYIRPMDGWWRRNPYYVRYMIMEATSVIVALYALILLVGVWRLSQGEAAYEAWLAALRQPLAVALHVFMLLAMIYHAYTWWKVLPKKVLPKTLPLLHVGGKPVPGLLLSAAGWTATLVVSAVVYALVRWWRL